MGADPVCGGLAWRKSTPSGTWARDANDFQSTAAFSRAVANPALKVCIVGSDITLFHVCPHDALCRCTPSIASTRSAPYAIDGV
jgi:hypothetical protein